MAVIQKTVTVAAGETVENLLSGSAFEFLRRNAIVSMGVVCDTSGQFVTIQSGSDIVLEESECAVKATYPTIPDEMYYNDVGVTGDRLVIRLRNASGGNVVFKAIVQLTDL